MVMMVAVVEPCGPQSRLHRHELFDVGCAFPLFESQSEHLPVDNSYRTGQLSRPMPLRTPTLADVTTFGSVYPRTRSR